MTFDLENPIHLSLTEKGLYCDLYSQTYGSFDDSVILRPLRLYQIPIKGRRPNTKSQVINWYPSLSEVYTEDVVIDENVKTSVGPL